MARRRGLTPADLTPEQLAAAGLSVPARGVLRSPHTGRGAKRGPSRLEADYLAHLEVRRAADEITAWAYEPITVRLPAKRGRYTADAAVSVYGYDKASAPFLPGLTLVEVKPRGKDGKPYWSRASKLRFRLAVEAMNGLAVLVVAWPRKGGGWHHEAVAP